MKSDDEKDELSENNKNVRENNENARMKYIYIFS